MAPMEILPVPIYLLRSETKQISGKWLLRQVMTRIRSLILLNCRLSSRDGSFIAYDRLQGKIFNFLFIFKLCISLHSTTSIATDECSQFLTWFVKLFLVCNMLNFGKMLNVSEWALDVKWMGELKALPSPAKGHSFGEIVLNSMARMEVNSFFFLFSLLKFGEVKIVMYVSGLML